MSDVSLTRLIVSLLTGGRTWRIICGTMMRRIVCVYVMPSDFAASYCPRPIDWMPARKISAKYAA